MWSNNDEFLKDIEVMDEIWEVNKVQNHVHKNLGSKHQKNLKINESKARSDLFDESDDEDEVKDAENEFEDENDPIKISMDIQRQIAEVTGNVHDHRVNTDYWRTTTEKREARKPEVKVEESKIAEDKSGFIVHSNFDIEKLKPCNAEAVKKPKNVRKKKGSVADAIQSSLQSKKEPIREKPKERSVIVDPVQLPSFCPSPRKVLTSYAQPSNRFSLPIHTDGYKDYYTGEKLADFEEDDIDFYTQQTGHWGYTDSERSSTSGSTISDRYGYRGDWSMSSNEEKILNINSDRDFPALS